jgi:hypothetical protein
LPKKRFKLKSRKHVNEIVEIREEWFGRLVERQEDEALPGLTTEWHKVVLARIESLQVVSVFRL